MGVNIYSEVYNLARIAIDNKDAEVAKILIPRIEALKTALGDIISKDSDKPKIELKPEVKYVPNDLPWN